MLSRGHILLIMNVVIYQNVCLDVWIAKMVPANLFLSIFKVKVKDQRSEL